MGKKTCKVFTPPDMVVYMLDKIIQMICSVRKYLKIHVVQVISFRKLLDVISGMGGHAK